MKNNSFTGIIMNKLLILAVFMLMQGCTTYTNNIIDKPYDNQTMVQQEDEKAIISEKNNTVSIAPLFQNTKGKERVEFHVSIKNNTVNSLDFKLDDIVAELRDPVNGGYLKKYTYGEIASEYNRGKGWATFHKVMHRLEVPLSFVASNGTNFQYTDHSKDEKKEDDGVETERQLMKSILRDTTILPGQTYNGILLVDLPKIKTNEKYSDSIDITVKLVDDWHKFHFQLERVERK